MTDLHPWLETQDALQAARAAAQIPLRLMGDKAHEFREEVNSLALVILTECAMPPRKRPNVRRRAKGPRGVHVGSMWGWPEDKRAQYAVREVACVLNSMLRARLVSARDDAA